MNKAWSKGLMRCPKCGQSPVQAPVDVETLVRCESCGFDALPGDWCPDPRGISTGHADQIPAGTRIQREGCIPGDCVWHIPPSGKFGFFLFFGIIWTTITVVVSGGFLFGTTAEGSAAPPWFIYPFLSIFWVIGFGCLYVAVRNKYSSHRITVTRDLVTLRREMFGKVKETSLVTRDIKTVEQTVFYQQNYQPVYGVEIRGHGGKLRFGTTLEEAEKAWLVADIKRAIFGEPETGSITSGSAEMNMAHRQSSFSFPLPPPPKGYWILGVILILAGLGGLVMGIFIFPSFPSHSKDEIDWMEWVFSCVFNLFSIIPVIGGLVFAGAGVRIVTTSWPGHGREIRLEGDESQVALRTYQHGRVIKEQSFPRSSVSDVRATRTGHVNDKPMKRIDLIVDGKGKRVTQWTAGDIADVWVGDVCRALGK